MVPASETISALATERVEDNPVDEKDASDRWSSSPTESDSMIELEIIT